MSCEGCFTTQKGIDRALNVAIAEATKQAKREQKSIAIVQEENGLAFYDAFYAYQNGMAPMIKTVVSYQ